MKTYNHNEHSRYIESQIRRHSCRQRLTKDREKFRQRDILDLKRLSPSTKSVLCVGARHESEVESFINTGFDAIGIDVVPCASKLVHRLDMHDLLNEFGQDSWDVVFSSHSLEHARNSIDVLRQMISVARLGVYLILPVMNSPTESDCSVFSFMENEESSDVESISTELNSYGLTGFNVIDSHVEKTPISEIHIFLDVTS